jgi:hypothetical protein
MLRYIVIYFIYIVKAYLSRVIGNFRRKIVRRSLSGDILPLELPLFNNESLAKELDEKLDERLSRKGIA